MRYQNHLTLKRVPDSSGLARQSALILVGTVLLGLLLLAGQSQSNLTASELAADGDLLGMVSVEHEIEFGRGIHIQLRADVSGAITEVRAVFTPAGARRISSYSYPEFSMPKGGGALQADFTINTGGSDYVPPGTEFELHFELTGADGSVTATETERILYLDPLKDWRLLATPGIPLDFYYYGFSDSVAEGLAARVSETWEKIAASIGLDTASVGRFKAIIYPNVREVNAVFPPTSAASTDGTFFGGFAMQRFGVFVLGGPSQGSVLHELTHLLVDTKVSSPLSPGVPSWLHEGLAQFFEAGSSSAYTPLLGRVALDDGLLTLRNRNTVPARGSEIGLFYTQVGSFVGGLIEDFGPEPMAETLRFINEGKTAADAVEIAYGQPLWQLENRWRVELGASELPPPLEPAENAASGKGTPEPSGTPLPQPTSTAGGDPVSDTGVTATEIDSPSGFNWTGPLIGAAAAAAVFFIWSFRVNRRRFRRTRR